MLLPFSGAKTPPGGRWSALVLALAMLAHACSAIFAQDARPGGAWLADWDFEKGWHDAAVLEPCLDTVQIFAAYFDREGKPVLPEPIQKWLEQIPSAADIPKERLILSVVNDVDSYGENPLAKDPEIITRFLATPESRQRHKQDLLDLALNDRFAGIELDYERVKISDWQRYLEFCQELAADLAARGKRLRVVLEPKREYYRRPLPDGPEYSIMAYNLFGGHSGPGPKANAAFIDQLYWQCQSARLENPRIALATGGFDWAGDKDAKSLSETQAKELAAQFGVTPLRRPDSRYLVFNYEAPDGKKHEVWYADGHTLAYLRRVVRAYGFDRVDLWRLGGNETASLEIIRDAILDLRSSAFLFSEPPEPTYDRDLLVTPAGAASLSPDPTGGMAAAGSFASISSAIAAARSGDRIIIAPGVYYENVVVDRPGLTLTAPPGAVADTPVCIVSPNPSEPTLLDLADTVWRGVAFTNREGGNVVSLVNFTGRFEHCRIQASEPENRPAEPVADRLKDYGSDEISHPVAVPESVNFANFAVLISGGKPSFHASTFLGAGGLGISLNLALPDSTEANRRIDFTYCHFEGFGQGVFLISGEADLAFANCLFSQNGMTVRGGRGYHGELNFLNSVFYHNFMGEITAGTPPALVSHCLYTPILNHGLVTAGTPLTGAIVKASRCLSPRFRDVGRPVAVGLGIDDSANAGVWQDLTRMGDRFGFKLTWAINTAAADAAVWETAHDGLARGHEIASHTSSHTPVTMAAPLALSYYRRDRRDAFLTIQPPGVLSVTSDGKKLYAKDLSDGKTSMGVLARELTRAGLSCEISPYYNGVPASLLARDVRLDIFFPKGKVTLAIDIDAFLKFELENSLAELRKNLPETRDFVFVHPYSISSEMSKQAIARAGYTASRTGLLADDQGNDRGGGHGAQTVRMNIFGLPGQTLGDVHNIPAYGDSVEERLRQVLDYLRLHFSAIVFYSHRWTEFSEAEWEVLMRLLRDDGHFQVMTLREIKEEVERRGREVAPLVYEYPLGERTRDYRPLPGSPLLGAGMNLGLRRDFAGRTLPANARPAIGLYEGGD